MIKSHTSSRTSVLKSYLRALRACAVSIVKMAAPLDSVASARNTGQTDRPPRTGAAFSSSPVSRGLTKMT